MFLVRDGDFVLRVLEERHAPEIFAAVDANRTHLRQWLPWVDSTRSVEDILTFVRGSLRSLGEGNVPQFGIWFEGKLVGVIGFHTVDHAHRKTELGYWLAETHQGRGLMTRACRALVEYSFGELELNRVEIRCATGNQRSCAIPQRLRFRQEGVLRQNEWLYDHFVDHAVYATLAEDWER